MGKVAEAATVQNVTDQAVGLFALGENLINRLSSKWSLYQIGIIIGLILLSYCVKLVLKPKIRAALGNLHGVPKPLLRILVLLNQRIALILFVLFSWITYFIMQAATWPSRSYFIGVVASLATAWVIIAVLTKLINNRTIRKFVAWGAWAYATLKILNLWDDTANLLETIAIDTGGIRISVMMVLTAIVTLGVLFALANVLNRSGARQIHNAQDMSPSIKALLTKALQLLLYGGALLFSLRAVGFDLGSLALLSGAIGLGIGFGLQKIVSNLISGIIILLDKSIKPGDVISLDGTFGWITQLGARYASITTRDGREYLVPNEDFITNQVINWTHSSDFVRLDIHFGVSYDSDPHFVKKIATDAPLSVNRVVSSPAPVCHIINFGDSSIDFKLRFWIKDPTSGLTNIRGNVYLALWDTLKEHNIEIPYPRRDVHMFTEPNQRPEPTKLPED
ncbi:mechanosensitive ion channel protein [Amylibacter kogurei]|uniref:Mechanosensitive ion channel protein n=1 Tax=Paramylibacter kogurei TaxID=1889778 RepID=A0A2G5K162_9RHOB|nr:mechanosensitive ion channel protein [Amylibacter kogurei]